MPQLGEVATIRAGSYPKPITAAAAQRNASLQPLNIYATMQGQRVLRDDLLVVANITRPMVVAILDFFADLMVETAKYLHSPNIDTQATYDSIDRSPIVATETQGVGVDVFVATPQAQFLEFGFVHHLSGEWIRNPFMIPAADLIAPLFAEAIEQVSEVALRRRVITGAARASAATPMLASVRRYLYSYSKFAGDIQVLGVSGLSKSRGLALQGAQGVGNIQAIQSGTAASRFVRVVTGRYGGRFGRAGVVSGFSGGNLLTGPSARIYNRVGGRVFGNVLSNIKLPGF